MVYTEIKIRNGKRYYYRVMSIRRGNNVSKKRKYLGVDLSKNELLSKEKKADEEFNLIITNRKREIINRIKPRIIKILKKNKIRRAGIFGSYARGEARKDSDVDILVQPPKGIGLGFVGIQLELENVLRKNVHLVTYKYIHPRLKKQILKDEVRII
jgi:predicted nucleotidyltransferase